MLGAIETGRPSCKSLCTAGMDSWLIDRYVAKFVKENVFVAVTDDTIYYGDVDSVSEELDLPDPVISAGGLVY